jgi:rod shape-determining protein MreD
VTGLRVVGALLASLVLQAGLGRLWPESQRYVDVMLVPVVWYGVSGSQRKGMLVGCAAGLLQDAWFQIGVLGLNGFKKTLVGWVLGGVGSRFDLNRPSAFFVCGVLASLADSLIDVGLLALLDQNLAPPSPVEWGVRALSVGLLTWLANDLAQRMRRRRETRYLG